MFDNISDKIKTLALFIFLIGIVISFIFGIIIISEGAFFSGLITMILSALGFCAYAFIIFGFGEIIDLLEYSNANTNKIYDMLKKMVPEVEKKSDERKSSFATSSPAVKMAIDGDWVCTNCGTKNTGRQQYCKDCGTYR